MLEGGFSAPTNMAGPASGGGIEQRTRLTPFVDALRDDAAAAASRWVQRAGLSVTRHEYLSTPAHEFNVLRLHVRAPAGAHLELCLGARDSVARETWRELARSADLRLFVADDERTAAALGLASVRAAIKALSLELRRAGKPGAAADPDVELISIPLNTFASVNDRMFRWLGDYDGVAQGVLRLGFRCNQDCAFCWQGRSWPDPPAHYYETWMRELVSAGTERIVITGGEPTLHRDLEHLVRLGASRGARVSLQTNAILLGRRELAAKLRAAGLSEASVSLHAGDAALSDQMTRAPGTFVRTTAGIESALRAGIAVNLTCVVERANVHALVEHARFIVERYGEHTASLSVAYAHPAEYYDQAQWADALVPLDLSGPAVGAAVTLLRRAGIVVNTQGGCGFPTCALRDFPEALQSLAPERLPAGEVESRMYAEECSGCALRPGCIGLRQVYFDKFGSRGLRPFDALTPMIQGLVRAPAR